MSDTLMALPNDHPMMKAWNAFCETDEFKNALRWAVEMKYDDGQPISNIQREQHAKGAMWLAFTNGLEAAEAAEWKRLLLSAWENRALNAEAELQKLREDAK